MLLSEKIKNLENVTDAAILMGTGNNKKRLDTLGFDKEELLLATNNDICIGIDFISEDGLSTAEKAIDDFLTGVNQNEGQQNTLGFKPQSIESAKEFMPGANLVSISLPGEYAAEQARKSLDLDLNVFLFSDNVSITDERELKEIAAQKGLMMMGPDCGTAMVNGNPLGFCNLIKRGPVGIVAASGTGAQEIMCILDHQGVGVSQVIGTGGRDLNKEIEAISTKVGLDVLNQDPNTETIILVSKPAYPEVEEDLKHFVRALKKPIIACFIGGEPGDTNAKSNWYRTNTLNHAALLAVSFEKNEPLPEKESFPQFKLNYAQAIDKYRRTLSPKQKYVRGLYSGGTLASEAAVLVSASIPEVYAGKGFGNVQPLKDIEKSQKNSFLDLGDDIFTQGRPHPMIDPSTRLERMRQEAKDPEVAVILMDIVMGTNTLEDPASVYIPVIQDFKQQAQGEGRNLIFVVHVCASQNDAGNSPRSQTQRFNDAGCLVFETNEEAAYMAASLLE